MITHFRIQQILIDAPSEISDPFLHVIIQRVDRSDDGIVTQVIDRFHHIHRKMSASVISCDMIRDPVLGTNILISIGGIATAIKAVALQWIQQELGGYIVGEQVRKN